MWLDFLQNFYGKSFLLPEEWESSDATRLFTDAFGLLGFDAVFGSNGLLMSGHKHFNLSRPEALV